MSVFDSIRPYHDSEVKEALEISMQHPMIKALVKFAFPELSLEEIKNKVLACKSIYDFQANILYHAVAQIIQRSSDGITTSGFNALEKDESYLFISNHRDIILDTSLLNCILIDKKMITTTSAIGDNLVQKPFMMRLSRLNRNFLVKRSASPRQLLQDSQILSSFIQESILKDNRSVWIAQREGRTKDGDDRTQQGILKMLAMAKPKEQDLLAYLYNLKIVPISISYEFDPTDRLKMPELLAKAYEEEYIKTANEDFNTILHGATGNKGRIHMAAGEVLRLDKNNIGLDCSINEQLDIIAKQIDHFIHQEFKLWPSNYIAYDLIFETNKYTAFYDEKQKRQFERRITRRVDKTNDIALKNFLLMYANPVINKENKQ